VVDLLIVVVVGAVPVLYAADRILKVRAQARRVRTMSDRLAAATARADKQEEKRQEVADFSAALTSVMPAIKRPPLSLPDASSPDAPRPGEPSDAETPAEPTPAETLAQLTPAETLVQLTPAEPPHSTGPHSTGPHSTGPHSTARPRTGCAQAGPQDHTHPRRPSRTGEHAVRSSDRALGR
jgi:hypothetical protein